MKIHLFVLNTLFFIFLTALAVPSNILTAVATPTAATLAAADPWNEYGSMIYGSSDSQLKYINTKNYYMTDNYGVFVTVDAADPTYTLRYDTDTPSATPSAYHGSEQMVRATVDGTDLLLIAHNRFKLHTLPLTPTTLPAAPATTLTLGTPTSTLATPTLATHGSTALFFSAYFDGGLKFDLTFLQLQADSEHMVNNHITVTTGNNETNAFNNSMATVASINKMDVAFIPHGTNGITTYYKGIGETLTEGYVSAGTELETAKFCFRMTRIGVSETSDTTTTVTLAVTCAEDGAGTGKPAVYVVQVPVVEGVPQTLTVTAKMVLERHDPVSLDQFLYNGGMAYLDGSLVLATNTYLYNFVITDPESPAPTLTLRSWFQSAHAALTSVTLLTPRVAVAGTHTNAGQHLSPTVLDLETNTTVQDVVLSPGYSATNLDYSIAGTFATNQSVVRLSDTSFLTLGGDGAIRRWDSCAGLGYDYTAAVLNTSDPSAPSATCTCPAGKKCLFGTAYDTCPDHTTPDTDGNCVPNAGVLINKPALSFIPCPKGHWCINNVTTPCAGNTYQSLEGQTECFTCPNHSAPSSDHTTCLVEAGYWIPFGSLYGGNAETELCPAGSSCTGGYKWDCYYKYQPHIGSSECWDCPSDSTPTPDHLTCTVDNGYLLVSGSFDNYGEAKIIECPEGHKCVANVKTPCEVNTYQYLTGQSTCPPCPTNTTTNDLTAQSHCVVPRGYYAEGGEGVICPAGHSCLGGCLPRTTCTGDEAVKTVCSLTNGELDASKYQDEEGQPNCKTVTEGYYTTYTTDIKARDGQTICPAGYKCVAGVQITCNGAFYQPAEGQTTCLTATPGYYTTPDAPTRTGQTECPAGYKCVDGVKTECVNNSTTREYQDQDARAECKACSDAGNYQYLISATSATCDYCPSTEYHTSTGCQPCNALTGANYCETKTDTNDVQFKLPSTCLPDQWRVNPYECRFCHSDEICHGDGTRTWKFKPTMDPETISGKMLIAIVVVGLIIICVLAFLLAYHLYHKGLSRRSTGANAKVEAAVVDMVQI